MEMSYGQFSQDLALQEGQFVLQGRFAVHRDTREMQKIFERSKNNLIRAHLINKISLP
jgi:hypothetical protein